MNDKTNPLLKLTVVLFAVAALFAFAPVAAFAQDEPKTRSIDAEDFLVRRRPPDGAATPKPAKRVKYNYVRKEQAVSRIKNKPVRPKPIPVKTSTVSDIGVTMWRLRPSLPDENVPKFSVKMADGSRQMWTPERVGADTAFRAGDKVRFAVESSTPGYLYVVNSEIYSDGSYGDPFLIFPATANEDNRVRPGLLVEIPDQLEQYAYFDIDPKQENYVGELVTVIVSPRRLTNLKTGENGRITTIEEVAKLEESADVETFAKEGGAGETYTKEEKESVCDQKTRQLVKEKEPCAKTRQLTRNEPPPQTIYRVKSAAGQPAVFSVRLNVNK